MRPHHCDHSVVAMARIKKNERDHAVAGMGSERRGMTAEDFNHNLQPLGGGKIVKRFFSLVVALAYVILLSQS